MKTSVGILGLGVNLPEHVRTNDYWPSDVVDRWQQRKSIAPAGADARSTNPWHRMVLEEMAAFAGDPFQGARERRIADAETMASTLEVAAAREALEDAGVELERVGLLSVYSGVPDYLASPNACAVHRALGLPDACLSMSQDNGCNTFHHQMSVARAMIEAGQIDCALLVQSSLGTRLLPEKTPRSAWFGDGATAVVLGPVDEGRGIVDLAHRTDGTTHDVLVAGVEGKAWYDDGPIVWHPRDRGRAARLVLDAPAQCDEVVSAVLDATGVKREEIEFFASHQATGWLPSLLRRAARVEHANQVDTFAWTGSLSAANVPIVLATAQREGLLRPGSLVLTFAGGTGVTYSAMLLRW